MSLGASTATRPFHLRPALRHPPCMPTKRPTTTRGRTARTMAKLLKDIEARDEHVQTTREQVQSALTPPEGPGPTLSPEGQQRIEALLQRAQHPSSPLPDMGEGSGARSEISPLPDVGEESGVRSEISPLPDVGEGSGVRSEISPLPDVGEGQGVRDNSPLHRNGEGQGVRSTPTTPRLPLTHGLVSEFESGDTTPDYPASSKKQCHGLKKNGRQCRAFALKWGDLCIYHEADQVTHMDEARARAGETTRRRAAFDRIELNISLSASHGIQAFLEAILRMQLAGAIPYRQVAQLHRTLRFAQHNFPNLLDDDDRSLTMAEADHFVSRAEEFRTAFENRDLAERLRDIEDAGSKRDEYLKANDRWHHNQPKPRQTPPTLPRYERDPYGIYT